MSSPDDVKLVIPRAQKARMKIVASIGRPISSMKRAILVVMLMILSLLSDTRLPCILPNFIRNSSRE